MYKRQALGLGHAVLMARELVGNEPFAVLLADDVIDAKVPCLKQMVEVFDQTQCSVLATQIIEGKMISSYGVLDVKPADGRFGGRLYEIKNMVEKPKPEDAPSNLAIIGRYILTPAIFDCLATVSYTHLDVYKRQVFVSPASLPRQKPCCWCCFSAPPDARSSF